MDREHIVLRSYKIPRTLYPSDYRLLTSRTRSEREKSNCHGEIISTHFSHGTLPTEPPDDDMLLLKSMRFWSPLPRTSTFFCGKDSYCMTLALRAFVSFRLSSSWISMCEISSRSLRFIAWNSSMTALSLFVHVTSSSADPPSISSTESSLSLVELRKARAWINVSAASIFLEKETRTDYFNDQIWGIPGEHESDTYSKIALCNVSLSILVLSISFRGSIADQAPEQINSIREIGTNWKNSGLPRNTIHLWRRQCVICEHIESSSGAHAARSVTRSHFLRRIRSSLLVAIARRSKLGSVLVRVILPFKVHRRFE